MPDQVIRPTAKLIAAGFVLVFLLIVAGVVVHIKYFQQYEIPFVPLVCALFNVWPAQRLMRRQFTKAELRGDMMRYQSGFLTRNTETIQISKMQSVKVRQTLGQRLIGIGDISFETAGETSRLTIPNVDAPQQVADGLNAAIIKASATGGSR
jgi:membrane protein YdbS with pleckstrin-like domain